MSLKYVYTLTSTPEDYYLEQAFASMYSLKLQMPEAHIVLLMDEQTSASLSGCRKKEIEYADDIVVVSLNSDHFSPKQRSRILKSSARQHISGDFLYIDCDTIIAKPLDSISAASFKLAACMDSHSLFIDNPYRWLCLRHGHLLNWPIDNEDVYFNSGVIYAADCPLSYEFYSRWNDNLIKGFSKGVDMDQPAFAKTNYEMGHPIQILDDVWNCELKHGIRYLKDARIVHYLTTNASPKPGKQLFRLNDTDLFEQMKESGEIPEEVHQICRDPFVGISSLTHCFSGDDIYFFQTQFYRDLGKRQTSFQDLASHPEQEEFFFQSDLYRYLSNHYPGVFTNLMERILRLGQKMNKIKSTH